MEINLITNKLAQFDRITSVGNFNRLDLFLSKKNNKITSEQLFQIICPMIGYKNQLGWDELEKRIFSKFPFKPNLDMSMMIELERVILNENHFFLNEFAAIEFPINIRAAHSVIPSEYLSGKYPTDSLHIDRWGMEPADIFNVLVYLQGDMETRCEFRKISADEINFLDQIDVFNEDQLHHSKEMCESMLKIIDSPMIGDFYIFDSSVPHATVRSNHVGRGRISLDFRFKHNDPYMEYEKYLKDGNPNDIRILKYWYPLAPEVKSLKDRYENELSLIEAKYGRNLAYVYREKEYLMMAGRK